MKLHLISPQLISELSFQHAIITITVAVIFYLFTNAVYQIYFSPLSKIPGPWYAAVSRLWVGSRALKGRLIFDVHALHERYGPYVRISPYEISVADVDSLRKIHSTQDLYLKSEWYSIISSGEDLGIAFITDHDLYKRRRKAYGNAFSNSNVRLLEPVVRKHIDRSIEKVKREMEGARTPDLKMWAQLLAADIIGEISYGLDFKMLENEKLDPFLKDTTSFFITMAMRGQFPIINLIDLILSKIPHPTIQWFFGCKKRLSEYSTEVLTNLKHEVQGCKGGEPRPTLFSKILGLMDNPSVKHSLTMEEVKSEAFINNLTGSHTTPSTATFIIWEIFRNEDIRTKLEQELIEFNVSKQGIMDETLQKLPYLSFILKEGLRLYAAAQTLIPRSVPKGGRQLGPHFFAEGTVLVSPIYTVQRDPHIFPDPYSFKPERWANPTKDMESAILAFGGASRVCLGQGLAMMQIRLLIASLLLSCPNAVLADSCTDDSMEIVEYLTISPKAGELKILAGTRHSPLGA